MPSEDAYRVTLARAAQYVGGSQALCERLGVPIHDMTTWLEGKAAPPIHIFLKVIEIVLEETRKTRFPPLPEPKPTKPAE